MSDYQEPIIEKLADLHFDEELVSTNPADIFSDDLPSDAELTNEELADNLDAFDAGLTSEELVDLLFDELATRPSVDLGRLRRAVRSTVRLSKHEAENATMRVTQLACL